MPFGASISCAHFQAFSDAVSHIVSTKMGNKRNINYLDDFFFVALLKAMCDEQLQCFLDVCKQINFPVALDKTFWGCTLITFLGLLIDTVNQLVLIPIEKIEKAKNLINFALNKASKKLELRQVQQLSGYLNFLCKAVIPGRTFNRRLYSLAENPKGLKKYHHIQITGEVRADLELWLTFLSHPSIYARPFMDLNTANGYSEEVDFFTDASANPLLGCGGISDDSWFILQWDEKFITKFCPSINYLELFAVTVGIVLWVNKYKNRRITIFCDNNSVVYMINKNSSKCKNCMVLLRILILQGLTHNVKISAKHVPGVQNTYSDLLSRLKYKEFKMHAKLGNRNFKNRAEKIPEILYPLDKLMDQK